MLYKRSGLLATAVAAHMAITPSSSPSDDKPPTHLLHFLCKKNERPRKARLFSRGCVDVADMKHRGVAATGPRGPHEGDAFRVVPDISAGRPKSWSAVALKRVPDRRFLGSESAASSRDCAESASPECAAM
jgi:hypothetical protein